LQAKTALRTKTPMRKRRPGKRRTLSVRSASWLDAVRSIECCVRCGRHGTEAAHRDFGKGGSMKTDDVATAAICPICHTELGNGRDMPREQRRAEMDKAIVDTLIFLARAGKVGAIGPGDCE
jgi:hypothetical protein